MKALRFFRTPAGEAFAVTIVCSVIALLLAAYRSWDALSFESCALSGCTMIPGAVSCR